MNSFLFISLFFLNTILPNWEGQQPNGIVLHPNVDSLPSQTLLFAALDSFYKLQQEAALTEFQSTNKKRWWTFLPTVGLTYTLEGRPRPAISWSSNLIYTSYKNKETNQAKQRSIIRKNDLNLQKDQLRLRALLQKYHAFQQDIAFLKTLFEFDTQLYAVKEDQAEHLEISPTELLKATQDYKKKAYDIFQKERALLELEWEILVLTHFVKH